MPGGQEFDVRECPEARNLTLGSAGQEFDVRECTGCRNLTLGSARGAGI